MTSLQQLFLTLHAQDPTMESAVKSGFFYANATRAGGESWVISLITLPDGQVFPELFASLESADEAVANEIQMCQDAAAAGDMESMETFPEIIEVRWSGLHEFQLNGRTVTLFKIQQGCC